MARPQKGNPQQAIRRIGLKPAPIADMYHFMLDASWPALLAMVFAAYLSLNAIFGFVYYEMPGSIEGVAPGNFGDAFFFSVQTMATIGYGKMVPVSSGAHVVVTIEALSGLLGFAIGTSIIFSKFARPTARVLFSEVALIAMRDGAPSLVFRCANQRGNQIVEATMTASCVKRELTAEGEPILRVYDLPLVRAHTAIFAMSWTVIHQIIPGSPLFGLKESEVNSGIELRIVASLTGVDETLAQPIYARYTYLLPDLRWNARFVDILSIQPNGSRVVDYSRFHELEPMPDDKKLPTA
jgi:inward rectifier potassium channel